MGQDWRCFISLWFIFCWAKINHINRNNYRGNGKYGLDVCPGGKGNMSITNTSGKTTRK